MAFLHCHTPNCNWSQDDFWSKDGYHPFRKDIVDWWIECIFKEKVYLDKFLAERPAFRLERTARSQVQRLLCIGPRAGGL